MTLTAVVHGSPETLALFIMAISQAVKARQAVHTSKQAAQSITVINHRARGKQDVVGITIRKVVPDSTRELAAVQAGVRRALIIALTILTAAVTVQLVTQQTAAAIVLTIAVRERVPAVRGLLVVQVPTIPILAMEVFIQVTVPECMAQLVAVRHRAEVSTIRQIATMSLGATGRPQFHSHYRLSHRVPTETTGSITHPAQTQM